MRPSNDPRFMILAQALADIAAAGCSRASSGDARTCLQRRQRENATPVGLCPACTAAAALARAEIG